MPGPEPKSQEIGGLKFLMVSKAICKLAPKEGETSVGKLSVGIKGVFIAKANKAIANKNIGKDIRLRLKNSLLAMPKTRIIDELIKRISQAV